MMVTILWKRKVMMWHGSITNIRRILTLLRLGEVAVGGIKDARMAEPDSRVEELQDLRANC